MSEDDLKWQIMSGIENFLVELSSDQCPDRGEIQRRATEHMRLLSPMLRGSAKLIINGEVVSERPV